MVFYVQPVAHVLSLAIYGQRFAMTDVVDKERNQFLRELIRTVVVRAVRHDGRHTVCVVERPDKVVAARLRGRIRTVRHILQVLREELFPVGVVMSRRGFCGERRFDTRWMSQFQCAIHFIGGDVVESFAFPLLGQALPIQLGGLQHTVCTHYVRLRKRERVFDAAVHMALRCQMDNARYLFLFHQAMDSRKVAYICLDETVIGLVLYVFEVGKIARIRQFIHVDYFVPGIFIDKQSYHVASYEARPAGDDNGFHTY